MGPRAGPARAGPHGGTRGSRRLTRAERPFVVILNGVGSVGKSSAARALQAITARPFLHVAMDAFIGMLPPHLFGHPDGLVFDPVEEDGVPALAVRSGPVQNRVMRGMRGAVAAMAAAGNHLVVDEVMIGGASQREYRALLSSCELRFVGLFAPLGVLLERERARGDRAVGLARWQFTRVHAGVDYDLEVDTAATTPDGCARLIRDAWDL